MARTFRGIRIDGSLLSDPGPGWSAEAYEAAVVREIGLLQKSPVGCLVLPPLSGRLLIRPFASRGMPNAFASAVRHNDSVSRSRLVRYCSGERAGEARDLDDRPEQVRTSLGSGFGSDVVIRFQPSLRDAGGVPGWEHLHADDMLLHEMVHGVRLVHGLGDCTNIGHRFLNFEEFVAVLITNVHRSCRGRHLRTCYTLPLRWERRLAISDTERVWMRRQLRRLRSEQPALTAGIARIDALRAPYNPLRDLPSEHVPENPFLERAPEAMDRIAQRPI